MNLRSLALITLLGVGSAACGGAERAPTSVLLVTVDTTRADALSCYGVGEGISPNLDRLASEGVRYEAAFTVAPITLPAHASMMTGLYPPRHGLRDNALSALPGSAWTVAEAAQAAGYQTAAVVGAVVLDPAFGLDQGFELYDSPTAVRAAAGHPTERPAKDVVDRALSWLEARDGTRPFFLWVHVYDPHHPYEPTKAAPRGLRSRDPVPEEYLAEVAETDRELGRLLEHLETRGDLDQTFVAILSDHGEAFGEHQELTHGAFAWNTTLHVPFLLRYPDGYRAGETSDEIVSVTDIAPTLAAAMGVPRPKDLDGSDLYRTRVPEDRGVYFETYAGWLSFGWSPLAGWIDRDGKYAHSSAPELFDLEQDPGELSNLFEGVGAVESYRTAIDRLASAGTLEGDANEAIGEELRSGIRALGYVGLGLDEGLPHPLAPSDRPSPHEMAGVLREAYAAQELLNQKKNRAAEKLLLGVLAKNPENSFARNLLVNALMRQKKYGESVKELAILLDSPLPQPRDHWKMGFSLERMGRFEEALPHLRTAIEQDGSQLQWVRKMVAVLRELERNDEADELEVKLKARGG